MLLASLTFRWCVSSAGSATAVPSRMHDELLPGRISTANVGHVCAESTNCVMWLEGKSTRTKGGYLPATMEVRWALAKSGRQSQWKTINYRGRPELGAAFCAWSPMPNGPKVHWLGASAAFGNDLTRGHTIDALIVQQFRAMQVRGGRVGFQPVQWFNGGPRGGQYGTFAVRPGNPGAAAVKRRTHGRRKALGCSMMTPRCPWKRRTSRSFRALRRSIGRRLIPRSWARCLSAD